MKLNIFTLFTLKKIKIFYNHIYCGQLDSSMNTPQLLNDITVFFYYLCKVGTVGCKKIPWLCLSKKLDLSNKGLVG